MEWAAAETKSINVADMDDADRELSAEEYLEEDFQDNLHQLLYYVLMHGTEGSANELKAWR